MLEVILESKVEAIAPSRPVGGTNYRMYVPKI